MISDVFFPRINGVSTSINTLRKSLAGLGHETVLVAPDYSGRRRPYVEEEENIVRIPSRRVPFDPEDRLMKASAIKKALKSLDLKSFDLLHIHTPFVAHYTGIKLAQKFDLATVETYHTFFEEYLFHYIPLLPTNWSKALARGLTRSQCKKLSSLIVPSSPMLNVLRDYGVSCPAEVIPTGIDLDEMRGGDGARFRQRFGIPSQRPVLVHVGRLAFEKNISFLIDVLQHLTREFPDIVMVLAGEGPAEDSLKKEVAKRGLTDNMLFVGYQSREQDLCDCFRSGEVFVFASRTETQGLVLLEAMALGVPVVSTAIMGTKDVLRDGKGCLIAKEDVEHFVRKVTEVLKSATLRERLSETGRDYARLWTTEEMTSRVVDHYIDIVAMTDDADEQDELSIFPCPDTMRRK